MQNGWNISQLCLNQWRILAVKQWIFFIKALNFGWILYCFVSFMTEIFCSAWILQLPKNIMNKTDHLCQVLVEGKNLFWHFVHRWRCGCSPYFHSFLRKWQLWLKIFNWNFCRKRKKTSAWIIDMHNRTAHIRHICRKTAVLSCYRCLINPVVEKFNYI
jgi:hypothetical protein